MVGVPGDGARLPGLAPGAVGHVQLALVDATDAVVGEEPGDATGSQLAVRLARRAGDLLRVVLGRVG